MRVSGVSQTPIYNSGRKEVISRFHGIVIKMYLRQREHNPPHIHAIYGDFIGMFSLDNGEMFEGDISTKVQVLIKEFIKHYRDKLIMMWYTQQLEVLPSIV